MSDIRHTSMRGVTGIATTVVSCLLLGSTIQLHADDKVLAAQLAKFQREAPKLASLWVDYVLGDQLQSE